MAEVRMEGLNEVLGAIDDLGDLSDLQKALGRACALVERAAKQKAPKGIGTLRRSITSRVEDTQGVIYTALEYAPYIEYGTGLFAEEGGRKDVPWHYRDDEGNWHTTSGMRPRPYMRPALNDNREEIIRIIREGIGK